MSDEIDNGQQKTRQSRRGRRKPRNGEIGIRYGKRNFLITPSQGLIAKDGAWHLVAVPEWARPGWWNFKLYFDADYKKNLFNLAVTENGLYERRDLKILREHFPERMHWAAEMAKKYIAGELKIQPEQGIRIKYSNKSGWRALPKGKNNG